MSITTWVSCLMLLLLFYAFFAISSSSGSDKPFTFLNNTEGEKLVSEYWNWWVNIPEEQTPEQQGPLNKCLIHKSGSVIFLLDPFQVNKITQTCDIPFGSSLFFPFYIGWCDNGNQGYYGEQSFQKMLDCALAADRGYVSMQAWLDGKKIVDMTVNNNDVNNLKVISNNLPQNSYYKEIKSTGFFNLTVSNKSQFKDSLYEKPEDFESTPAHYKAAGHCFCGFISSLAPGTHELIYRTDLTGSEGLDLTSGWNGKSDITYNLNILK